MTGEFEPGVSALLCPSKAHNFPSRTAYASLTVFRRRADTRDLCPHACVRAAVVTTGADNFDLFRNPLAMSAAILFFIGRGTGAGRVRAFLGSIGHKSSSMPGRLPV